MRIVYIAHPLGQGRDREANRRAASEWVAWLAEKFEIAPVADWVILSGHWWECPTFRARGLAIDLALIERVDEVWMVGPRVSEGMRLERDHAWKLGKRVRDLTGISFPPEYGLLRQVVEL